MTTIISGNFPHRTEAQRALSDLASAGFAADRTASFFVNPPGQHDLYPIGGDEAESPGTEQASAGSATGAAVGGAVGVAVGLATLPVIGPGAAVAGAGAGAYTGSLYGAPGSMDDKGRPGLQTASRKSGMLVAVSAPASAQQGTAIGILRRYGATDIERTDGSIVRGEWTDFNPLAPLRLVG